MSMQRETLNGAWILDKTRGEWSMNKYLETMLVDPLAIEAHEKGEKECDTIHTVTLDRETVRIVKRSRVNNDVVVELRLGVPDIQYLAPGDRPKKSLARSHHLGHLEIQSSLETLYGLASVTDTRTLEQEEGKSVMRQELKIVNEKMNKNHTTIRYFVPYLDTPPHMVDENASTASSSKENVESKS